MQTSRACVIACYASFVVFVIGIAGYFGYSTHYKYWNPTSPDSRTGHIYPHNDHGTVVYLNEKELLTIQVLDGAMWTGMLGFFIGGSFAGFFRNKK